MIEFFILLKLLWIFVLGYCPILTISIASTCCGALIGFERALADKPAGIRTTILVVLGAALFTYMSPLMADMNTTRIAANVVVGIGFIGAGTIMRDRGQIQGITTAATMWVCAALGMMIGGMFYLDAFLVTLLVVVILNILGRLEFAFKRSK